MNARRSGLVVGVIVSLGLVLAGSAAATTATSASATIAFSGTGTKMTLVTSVKFTSTYTGTYNVKYDIYRSTSSTKSSPVKVNTSTVFTKTIATSKGKAYTYGPNSSKCLAGLTTYYYWVQGAVTDTTGGTVAVASPVLAGKACTSL